MLSSSSVVVDCLLQTPAAIVQQPSSSSNHHPLVDRSIQHIPPFDDDDDTTDPEVQAATFSSSAVTGVSTRSSSEETNNNNNNGLSSSSSSSSDKNEKEQEHWTTTALSDMTPELPIHNNTDSTNNTNMLRLVQQLQHRHEQERADWKDALRAADAKKVQYKLELRHTIANQLEWLEHRLSSTTPSETTNGGGPSKTKVLQELLALTDQQHKHDQQQWQSQEQHLQDRILHLESLVEQWTTTTTTQQKNTTTTTTGEQQQPTTSSTTAIEQQQQHQLLLLQAQLAAAQQENEERDALQEELVTELEAAREAADVQQERADRWEQQCKSIQQAQAQQSSPNKNKVVQHRVEWEDKLDRAVAERDMLRQEAEQLRAQLLQTQQQQQPTSTSTSSARQLRVELESIKTKYIAEQHVWQQQLQAASRQSATDLAAAQAQVTELQKKNAQLLRSETAAAETVQQQQQLNDAMENSRRLEEALANEADRHAKEVRELKAHVLQLESQAKLRRSQQQETEQRWTQEKSELEERMKESARKWKAVAEEKEKEMDQKCRDLLEKHRTEICELAAHLEVIAKENECHQPLALQRLTDMAEQHTMEKREWSDKLDASTGENTRLKAEVEQLSQVLVDLKTLHTNTMTNYQTVMSEKERLQAELERLKAKEMASMEEEARTTEEATRDQAAVLLQNIHELRGDFVRLQERVADDTRVERNVDIASYLDSFRDDLANIQSSLNDAVAELTLEADAMLESREAIKSVASDASSSLGQQKDSAKSSRLQEQQDTLLAEVLHLKNNLDAALAQSRPENAISEEEMLHLRRAEVEVAVSRTEMAHCREKLEAEIAARQKAEAEIGALVEQADAYEEQLMTMQSLNDALSRKLHIAGLKIDASLVEMPANDDVLSTMATPRPDQSVKSPSARSEDLSVPLLDEALAMAENLTHIVNENGGEKTSLMEMLESMSEMIDAQGEATIGKTPPAFSPPTSPLSCPERRSLAYESPDGRSKRYSSISPMERHRKLYDDHSGNIEVVHEARSPASVPDERTPKPVETPAQEPSSSVAVRTLQAIVEQLYARCQLLERERAEMMEMSLEMLESVKESNEAEVDAALATARRKASEDLLRMKRETSGCQERAMKRLLKNQG